MAWASSIMRYLFWQFTLEAIEELDIVANQNLCVEMFLIRLMYLKGYKKNTNKDSIIIKDNVEKKNIKSDSENHKIINQIKNITQQDEIKPMAKPQETTSKLFINSFEELIKLCIKKKEIKFKRNIENKKCPAWELQSEEFVHDKEKKVFEYKNSWLKLFDSYIGKTAVRYKDNHIV